MPRGRGAFRSLARNKALVRVVGGYVLFTLTQYPVWMAMLVYAYRHGGAAVAQLAPAAGMASTAVAVMAGVPLAAYAAAVGPARAMERQRRPAPCRRPPIRRYPRQQKPAAGKP